MEIPKFTVWLVRTFLSVIVRLFYRIDVRGVIPEGGALLLPNHLTWVDAAVLQAATKRTIRFLVFDETYNVHWVKPILHILGAIPVSSTRAKDAIVRAAELLKQGELVCIFPEGTLSRNGALLRMQRGYELIARKSKSPMIPVWLDGLWGSIFSFERGNFFRKRPNQLPYPVSVTFGVPLATPDSLRTALLEMSADAFSKRPTINRNLGKSLWDSLSNKNLVLIDGDKHLTGRELLAAALSLPKLEGEVIGIALPPGGGATIANLGVILQGKIPCNLNPTGDINHCLNKASITTVLTAEIVKKMMKLPFGTDITALVSRKKAVLWTIALACLPNGLLQLFRPLGKKGDEPAVLLFTSGSSGSPKGVPLSHKNVLGNVLQFQEQLLAYKTQMTPILGSLPLFHSLGCTASLWHPLLHGGIIVSHYSPLDPGAHAKLIQKHAVKVLITTPTFLRGYLRKATPEQLASLELVVTGAERLPEPLAEEFQKKFGKTVDQGYGLTETSPVISFSSPDVQPWNEFQEIHRNRKPGSVGHLVNGLGARLINPETGAIEASRGVLEVRGVNVFGGYLGGEKRESWLSTGDLVRIDEDGFLFIEGRISRFSKIGGEMVPHETVEAAMETETESRTVVILSEPHPEKGEALILVTTREITQEDVRKLAAEKGLPNLFVPRKIVKIAALPMLASGKVDLQGVKKLLAAVQ